MTVLLACVTPDIKAWHYPIEKESYCSNKTQELIKSQLQQLSG